MGVLRLGVDIVRGTRCYSTRRDMFKVLGVTRNATADEIKESYYTLSKKYHPDSPTADPRKFLAIKNAYEKLKENTKRPEEKGGMRLHTFTQDDVDRVDQRFKNYYKSRTVDCKAYRPIVKAEKEEYEEVYQRKGWWEKTVDYVNDLHVLIRLGFCATFGLFLGFMTFWAARMRKLEKYRRDNPHLVYE